MKKFLTRFIAVALMAILFAAPSIAQAASVPVLLVDHEGYKAYRYDPAPYYLAGNQSVILQDTTTSDGWWHVPAGDEFLVNIYLTDSQYYRVLIVSSTDGTVLNTGVITEKYPQFILPALAKDTKYQVWVTAFSNLEIEGYDGYHYSN